MASFAAAYTAIHSHIPCQFPVELLHNHREITQLNPLVIGHHRHRSTTKHRDGWTP